MPRLAQFDYIFGIGTCFAFLDAYQIGANDVANSFATSVASKSLTMAQACIAAAICEFLGAVLVGARVSGTIKNGIIPIAVFQNNAGVQMLAFFSALVASSLWLTFATWRGFPVSTTYSIVSSLAGVGIAVGGINAPNWGWNNANGLAAIFAGFGIAPAISAGFGIIIYSINKYGVLTRQNSAMWALWLGPFWFFTAVSVLTMVIVYKGSPQLNLDELSGQTTALAIVLTALVVSIIAIIFWVPYVRAKSIKHDYTIRFYHIFVGPLLWNRPAPADAGSIGSKAAVVDYRVHPTHDDSDVPPIMAGKDGPHNPATLANRNSDDIEKSAPHSPVESERHESKLARQETGPKIEGPWILPRNLYIIARYKLPKFLLHGINMDVTARQLAGSDGDRLRQMHARTAIYPNETEHVYSFLQALTACTASFAHGANDVANAIGPYSAIYAAWSTGLPVGRSSDVPVWILVFGGAAIVIGLATYGYNIMGALGNKLTMMSPSRGFSMELASAITVIIASQFGLPVSTTMCITGATLGVALVNWDLKTYNWRQLAYIVSGWILTIPIAGLMGYCFMAFILNAPHF